MTSNPIPMRHFLALVSLTGVLTLAASCTEDHLVRQEGVTSEVGNANRVNMVQMATDTRPRSAQRLSHATDGTRMANAIENYHNPLPPVAPSDASTTDTAEKKQ